MKLRRTRSFCKSSSRRTRSYVAIPFGPHLSDALLKSPILQGEDGAAAPGQNFEFGVDPYEDPELALALRVSMEEQHQHQEAGSSGQTGGEQPASSTTTSSAPTSSGGQDDEQLLQRALEMSMTGEAGAAGASSGAEPDLASMTEEEPIAYTMRMSMQDSEPAASGAADDKMEVDKPESEKKGGENYSEVMNDPQFLHSVLESLPGVDLQSEAVKKAIGAMTGSETSDKDKKSKGGKKDQKKDGDKK